MVVGLYPESWAIIRASPVVPGGIRMKHARLVGLALAFAIVMAGVMVIGGSDQATPAAATPAEASPAAVTPAATVPDAAPAE